MENPTTRSRTRACGPGAPGHTPEVSMSSRAAALPLFCLLLCSALTLGAQEAEPKPTLPVTGEVQRPVRLSGEAPQYSEIAKEARLQGSVILEAVVENDGSIGRVRTIKGLPMELTENAIAAVKTWRYEPATLHGEPVAVFYNLTINFRLKELMKPEDDPAAG